MPKEQGSDSSVAETPQEEPVSQDEDVQKEPVYQDSEAKTAEERVPPKRNQEKKPPLNLNGQQISH